MSHEKKKKLATKALSKLSFFFGAHTDTHKNTDSFTGEPMKWG